MILTQHECQVVALALRNEKVLAEEHARMLSREFGNDTLANVWFQNAEMLERLSTWFAGRAKVGGFAYRETVKPSTTS